VSLDPMSIEQATMLVKRLLAGFPNLAAHDPEGYVKALIEVMGTYPAWAGHSAIMKVDADNEFPPSAKKLRVWLDDTVRPYRFAVAWNARSAKQIAESQQIPERPELPQEGRGQIYWNYDEAVSANGNKPPIGAFEKIGRTVTYRG
jgi:hypothetical protein